MKAEKFLSSATTQENICAFSQSDFRRKFLPDFNSPLCSGLVDGWIRAKQQGVDFSPNLSAPPPGFLEFIVERQLNNYYPILSSTGDMVLSEVDKKLLKKKYNVDNLDQLNSQIKDSGAKDILSFDFLRFFNTKNVNISGYTQTEDEFFKTIFPVEMANTTYIQILILRYAVKKDGEYFRKSHRIGIYYDDPEWHFFDPNAGCAQFKNICSAKAWFESFWKQSAYSKLQSLPRTDLMTIYTLYS